MSIVSGTCHPEDYCFTAQEMEYLSKLDWLWQQISPLQRSKIVHSVIDGTLRQGSCSHCFIEEAISANIAKDSHSNYFLFGKMLKVVRAIFYEGPSFDFLLDKKISNEDKEKLEDIYYARVGYSEHQYQRATELVRTYVTNLLIATKQ